MTRNGASKPCNIFVYTRCDFEDHLVEEWIEYVLIQGCDDGTRNKESDVFDRPRAVTTEEAIGIYIIIFVLLLAIT